MQQHHWTTVLLVTALLWLEVAATTRPKRSVWSGRSITTNNDDDDKGKKEESFVELEPSTPCSSGYNGRDLLSVARAATLSRGSSSPFVRSSAAFLLLGDSGLVASSSSSGRRLTAATCRNDENTFSKARRCNTKFQEYNKKGARKLFQRTGQKNLAKDQ